MKKYVFVLIGLILLPMVCADWNTFMHDEKNTGLNEIDVGTINSVIWKTDLEGRICGSPVIVENNVYIGSEGYFYKLDLNGNVVWKKEMNTLWSTPTVVNDTVYVGTWNGYVYALNTDGKTIWKQEIGKEIRNAPLVYKGNVFIGKGALTPKFYCLDADTGEIKWEYETVSPVKTTASVWNDHIYVIFQNDIYADELCCFTPEGELVWKYKTVKVPEGACIPPISVRSTQGVTSSPTVYNGKIYFGSGKKKVHCIDSDTGEPSWTFETKGSVVMEQYRTGEDRIISTLGAAYENVYFGSWNNTIYALDAETGKEKWTFLTGDRILSSPVIADGLVCVGCMDGHFYCLDAYKGNLLGDFKLGKVVGSPAISNGYVFVPVESTLYCLGEEELETKAPKAPEESAVEQSSEPEKTSNNTYYIVGAAVAIIVLIVIGMVRR